MVRSQLTKDIVTNEITLEEGLQRLLLIIHDLNNKLLMNWIQNELNGYSVDAELPFYRKNISCVTYYSGFNGRTQVTHQPLPSNYVNEEYRDLLITHDSRDNIKVIERITTESKNVGVQLTNLASHINENTGVLCYNIWKEINLLELEQILSIIKNKIILILLELEKKFDSLDTLDINIRDLEEETPEKLNKQLNNLIFSDGKGEEFNYG